MIAAPVLTPHNGEDEAEWWRESQPALDRPQAQPALAENPSKSVLLPNKHTAKLSFWANKW